jgi:outer membrane biosynthesis protein TonB
MRNRVFPLLAIALSVLLTSMPVQAGPVVVSNVVQVLTSYQNPPDLRLKSVSQSSSPLDYRLDDQGQKNDDKKSGGGDQSKNTEIIAGSDSLLNGMSVDASSQPLGVQVVDAGDVEGTVCDCGEILVPGGVPKWPLLFLAAIPLFFIHNCDDCDTPSPTPTPPNNQSSPTPTPTPTPTSTPTPPPSPTPPSQVPEPSTLLLFGTGILAAGDFLRRRYGKSANPTKSSDDGGSN